MSFENIINSAKKLNKKLNEPAPKLITSINPAYKTNDTIAELKEVIIQQGIIADKQAISIKRLTYLALVFAFISITPIVKEYIPIIAPKNYERDLYELKNKVLSISNAILEKQVRMLKVEKEQLKSKKTFVKEKSYNNKIILKDD
ncbi:hypothetical protein [Flavobacterium yafengii]|uniref:hypothetical protein n=1 Tax=Flavobacterium yafengii TaxID=3041253 RepID=UPI0024A8754E|nr:hypothetical protein [Flavobacterium yafengii]MDI6047256.1 hypothetical protein [Flavobacterium yafengii]